jgi:hypothetical protein
MLAQHDQIGKFAQALAGRALRRRQGVECGLRLVAQTMRQLARGVETQRRDVGGLVLLRVLARGFSEGV